MENKIRLTGTVKKGGCAAKIPAEVLKKVLGEIDFKTDDKNVLVSNADFDDAGIYQLAEKLAMVQTLDFFTPIVDSPYLFGQVASANALSDVYAMGGDPKTAMAILAFPLLTLDEFLMKDILTGARDKINEANSTLVGGHSIDDDTIKFGLSVTGIVDPTKMWTNSGAKDGDVLILTKGLGTGTLCAALKNGVYTEDDLVDGMTSMTTLNKIKDLLKPDELEAVHAATDVTGFGILGHLMQMSLASKISFKLDFKSLPTLEFALESLSSNLTKAHRTNESYTKEFVKISEKIDPIHKKILFDPQTSGGLLLSVAKDKSESILKAIKTRFKKASIVGEASPSEKLEIEVYE